MGVKRSIDENAKTFSMLTTDIKPTVANDGDTLEVLDDALNTVVEIWRWHASKWYKY